MPEVLPRAVETPNAGWIANFASYFKALKSSPERPSKELRQDFREERTTRSGVAFFCFGAEGVIGSPSVCFRYGWR